MASKNPTRMTRREREFFDKALLVGAGVTGLRGRGNSPEIRAHLTTDYAIALVIERRRVIRGQV